MPSAPPPGRCSDYARPLLASLTGVTKDAYRRGSEPAVIVLAEMPGITPRVLDFAWRVANLGCTAVVAHLFGVARADPISSAPRVALLEGNLVEVGDRSPSRSADLSSVGCRSMDWERDWDGRPIYYDRQGKPMTMQQWAQKFEDEDYRRVARDVIGPDEPLDPAPLITVSTFWLGLNHDWRSDKPLIYETIIIGGEHDATGMRYTTEKQARDGHRRAVDELRAGRARHRRVDIRHD